MVPTPADPTETERLLERIRTGETAAFELLFARYRAYVAQVVGLRLDARLRARVDPSDVVQETQLEAFRRLGEYLERRPMPFRLWLRKAACEQVQKAARRHLAARRSTKREQAWPDRSSLLLARRLGLAPSTPSQRLSRRERARAVRLALDELPTMDREILIMRHLEGLSYEEIAYLLEIQAPAARKRYGRALLRLRTLLAHRGLLESEP